MDRFTLKEYRKLIIDSLPHKNKEFLSKIYQMTERQCQILLMLRSPIDLEVLEIVRGMNKNQIRVCLQISHLTLKVLRAVIEIRKKLLKIFAYQKLTVKDLYLLRNLGYYKCKLVTELRAIDIKMLRLIASMNRRQFNRFTALPKEKQNVNFAKYLSLLRYNEFECLIFILDHYNVDSYLLNYLNKPDGFGLFLILFHIQIINEDAINIFHLGVNIVNVSFSATVNNEEGHITLSIATLEEYINV